VTAFFRDRHKSIFRVFFIKESAEKLATLVARVVFDFAGGVGTRP